MLEETIRAYRNRAIQTAQVIEELAALATEIRAAGDKASQLGLSEGEIAFFDALGVKESAVEVLGDAKLKPIAKELVESARRHVVSNLTTKETVRAKLPMMVKRILRNHGYHRTCKKRRPRLCWNRLKCFARLGDVAG